LDIRFFPRMVKTNRTAQRVDSTRTNRVLNAAPHEANRYG
jgi:hypothetical protein